MRLNQLKSRIDNEQGMALPLVLIVVTLILLSLSAIQYSVSNAVVLSKKLNETSQARVISDSAADWFTQEAATEPVTDGTVVDYAFDDQRGYTIRVIDVTPTEVTFTSTGYAADAEYEQEYTTTIDSID